MRRRTPLVAAVVGALVIGGATTGTTHALWHDNADVSAGSLQSGVMSNTVNGGEAALGSVTLQPGGAGVSVETTIRDTSFDGSKNLNQRFRVADTSFSSTTGLSDSDLKLSVTPKPAGGCPTTPPTNPVPGYTSGVLGTTAPAALDQTLDVCVTVAATSAAAAGRSGVIELGFLGEQVRPGGVVAGWRTPVANRAVSVSISAPSVPAPSGVSCGDVTSAGRLLSWTTAGTGLSYRVYRVDVTPNVLIADNITSTSVRITQGQQQNNSTYAVRAYSGFTESVNATPRIRIQWQSNQCVEVTP